MTRRSRAGVLGAGDTLADSTTTDSSGYYEFTDLAPGEYIIVEGSMSGWVQPAPNGADSDPESGDVNGSGSGYGEYGYAIDLMGGDKKFVDRLDGAVPSTADAEFIASALRMLGVTDVS